MELTIIKYNEAIIEFGERVSKKLKVYIESTIPSYLVSRPNKILLVRAHQQITKDWWKNERDKYSLYISKIVIEEISSGDVNLSKKRLDVIKGIPVLDVTKEVEDLALTYISALDFPKKVARDAFHLAVAVDHKMDCIVTWNSTHLANEYIRRRLLSFNNKHNLKTPMLFTPEELIYSKEHSIR